MLDYNSLPSISRVAAIVLAGGPEDAFSKTFEVSHKALVPIHKKPMAYYVLRALRDSASIAFISYVGEADRSINDMADVVVTSGKGMSESLIAGVEATQHQYDYFLVLSADMPWLTSGAIDNFIEQSPPADLIYSIIPKAVLEVEFPGQKRTYVKITEGLFTGGNVVLLSREGLPQLLRVLNQLHQARKNPIKLATLFGFDMIFKLILGRLRIPELEARASTILGIQSRAVIVKDACLGADIDKPEHLQSEHLERLKGL
jgi:molybdopterin-guanine dinucleotide biosynthesis protein A